MVRGRIDVKRNSKVRGEFCTQHESKDIAEHELALAILQPDDTGRRLKVRKCSMYSSPLSSTR